MKYGEVFELTGKGKLQDIIDRLSVVRSKLNADRFDNFDRSDEYHASTHAGVRTTGDLLVQASLLKTAVNQRGRPVFNVLMNKAIDRKNDVRKRDADVADPNQWLKKKMLTRKDEAQ